MKEGLMGVTVLPLDKVVLVSKPWGYERWIAHGTPDFRYALKEIFLKAGNRSSLQFHAEKQETNFIRSGKGLLHYSDERIDVARYRAGGYTPRDIARLRDGLKQVALGPDTVFHVQPGFLHRVESITDLLMIEASTVELDDVIRIADDTNRGSGRIASEHVATNP